MALRKRFATAALLAALALAIVASSGCTKVITAPAGTAANTVTASGIGHRAGDP